MRKLIGILKHLHELDGYLIFIESRQMLLLRCALLVSLYVFNAAKAVRDLQEVWREVIIEYMIFVYPCLKLFNDWKFIISILFSFAPFCMHFYGLLVKLDHDLLHQAIRRLCACKIVEWLLCSLILIPSQIF